MSESSQLAVKIIIAKLIIPRMEEKGLKVSELSRMTGISNQTLHRWMTGEQNITLTKFIEILTALELNPLFIPKELDNKDYNYIHLN